MSTSYSHGNITEKKENKTRRNRRQNNTFYVFSDYNAAYDLHAYSEMPAQNEKKKKNAKVYSLSVGPTDRSDCALFDFNTVVN